MSLLAQDERIAQRVGAIALLVIAASIAFVVFFLDHLELGTPTRIRVYFHHSAGLREKAPLVVAGVAIGEIESIDTVPHGGTNPLGGDVGSVATVAIDDGEAWKVSRKAEVFVSSRGMLSEKYLEVAPPPGDPGPAVSDGAELLAADPPSLDTVLQRTWTNMATYRLFVEQVRPELDLLRGEIEILRAHLAPLPDVGPAFDDGSQTVDLATAIRDESLGGQLGLDRLAAMIGRAQTTLTQTRAMLDLLSPRSAELSAQLTRVSGRLAAQDAPAQLDAVLSRIRVAIDKVDPLLATVADLTGRLARGEGSMGRLMNDPEFPEDAKELGKILKRRPWRIIVKPIN
ncbi:MAG: MCE family protein [Deltaproteobacteria bacterium]|nr:MCE family protein [Deltaproteobacteria bacterium]